MWQLKNESLQKRNTTEQTKCGIRHKVNCKNESYLSQSKLKQTQSLELHRKTKNLQTWDKLSAKQRKHVQEYERWVPQLSASQVTLVRNKLPAEFK